MIKKTKILSVILAAVLVTGALSACGDRATVSGSSGGEDSQNTSSIASTMPEQDESSSSSSDTEAGSDIMVAKTPAEVAEQFKQALLKNDMPAIKVLTEAWSNELYADWATVKFEDISFKTLSDDYSTAGYYDFSFTASESDCPTFPVGTSKREVQIMMGQNDHFVVKAMYTPDVMPFERTPYDSARDGYEAYDFVHIYLSFMPTQVFKDTAAIPLEEVVEYCTIIMARESDYEKSEFTPTEVTAKAEELFGLKNLDGTSTKFFNKTKGVYEIFGRGGYSYHRQAMSADFDEATSTYTLPVTFYTDALCTIKEKTIVYKIKKNGEKLQFISAALEA